MPLYATVNSLYGHIVRGVETPAGNGLMTGRGNQVSEESANEATVTSGYMSRIGIRTLKMAGFLAVSLQTKVETGTLTKKTHVLLAMAYRLLIMLPLPSLRPLPSIIEDMMQRTSCGDSKYR